MDKRQRKHNRFRSMMTKEQTDALRGTEIVSKRTRCGKVFAMGGNRFQAVTYTDPVHRYNEKTHSWDEIDNRFTATPRMKETRAAWKKGIMPAVERGESLLECKTGNLDIDCSVAGEAPFITLTDKAGRQLSWGIEGAMSILPDAEEIQDAAPANVRQLREKSLSRLHGEVVYGGIFSGVDLRCKLDRGFKDELIFAEKESIRPITFLLESEGRQMELTEQNALLVKDTQGEVVFRLQAPFMEDARHHHGSVTVQLEALAGGMYSMTYIPDTTFAASATYPVILDPAVETVSEDGGIVDTCVAQLQSGDYSSLNRLVICNDDYYGICNAYMRVAQLPALGANHYITSAYLCVKNYSQLSAETTLVMSEVLEDWNTSTISYENQPAHSSLYQDCVTFPKKQEGSDSTENSYLDYVWRELDVTSLARKWYLGENYGVVFTPAPTTHTDIQLNSSEGSAKPYFVVNYASLAGLENYLTYDGQNAGLAGTGAVSLVNGNLVFAHNDTFMNGNRMPVSVTHYYNSCDADRNEFGLGYGWRTSLHQTLHKEYVNGEVMYVYTDGDGTEHWFELDEEADSVQHVDLSGLSLTLTETDDTVTITSKGDSRMIFPAIAAAPTSETPVTVKVLMSAQYDAVGNQIIITPVDGQTLRIREVIDGAGRKTTFTYADGLCDAIMTPWQTSDSCTRFSYTDSKLVEIIHEDNRTASYSYEMRNGYALLTSTSGVDGVAATYSYSNTGAVDGLPHCIIAAATTGSQNDVTLAAANTSYTYGNHMTLVQDNISGKTLRYHFNDNGNQISVDDELGYAVYTRYDQTGNNVNAPINHATLRSRMQRVVKNLLTDSMFELNSSAWEKSSSGVSRDAGTIHWGILSYKLSANTAGRYLRQAVNLIPGKSYTFSGYLRSSAEKTFLRITYTVNGESVHVDSDPTKVYSSPAYKPFERVAVSFSLPEDAEIQVTCAVMCMGSSGYGWASSMQLEEGLTCNHFNMLQDQDFTVLSTNTSSAACWRVNKDTLSAYVSTKTLENCAVAPPATLSGRALHLESHYNPNYSLVAEQEIRLSGKAGDRFTVGGWCSSFTKLHDEVAGVRCCIDVLFPFTASGSTGWVSGGKAVFNYEEGNWQFACGSVTAPHNYARILVRVDMSQQMNSADVTGLFLYPEAFGAEYIYDANGNRKESKKLYGATENADYDSCDNLIRHIAPGSTLASTFSYGDTEEEQKKHLLRRSTSPLGTVGEFTYDEFGNVTMGDTLGEDENALIRGASTYTADGNYATTQTDARGKTVTIMTDTDKGTTTSVTDPKGQRVSYEYDSQRRTKKVNAIAGVRSYSNEYAYDNATGQLISVKHNTDASTENDVEYTFEYDALGRRTKVKVGNAILSENEYQNDPAKPNYGMLSKMTYGNGMVVRNQYDDFNRVTGVYYGTEETPRYEFSHNAQGQIAHVKNNLLGCVTEQEYDLANRPRRVKVHEGSQHVYTSEAAYDDTCGNLSELKEKVGESRAEYVTTFGYDEENRPTTLTYGSHGQSALTYDTLGRVRQSSVKAGSGATMTTTYAFEAGGHGENSTTGQIKSISQTGGSFAYTYDDNGNITSVVQDGVTTAYTYDELGQLIRVDDEQENATWVYEYDMGGNILSKQKFALGVTTGTPVESKTFTYGNANWRDQLTAVNGVAITYDAIGNPLSDGEWTYTWQNGRQLARMQQDGVDASFVYNENGLRVQKTVNGVVTNYTLRGKNVVHMTQGDNELHFYYDAQGKPSVVVYNGTPYSYVKNLQGDIVAILNSAGTVVVSYVYDAWGRPIATTGSMADTLGVLNPFRYRGYVFDEETGIYYLRSRYYTFDRCRFSNADSYPVPNLYSYCCNKPVRTVDMDGHDSIDTQELLDMYLHQKYYYYPWDWDRLKCQFHETEMKTETLNFRSSPYIVDNDAPESNRIRVLRPNHIKYIYRIGDAFLEGTDVPEYATRQDPNRVWMKVVVIYGRGEGGALISEEGYLAADYLYSRGLISYVYCPPEKKPEVNLRNGPGLEHDIIGSVPEYTGVDILFETDNGWAYVATWGTNGWMDTRFLPLN